VNGSGNAKEYQEYGLMGSIGCKRFRRGRIDEHRALQFRLRINRPAALRRLI
jgi:hypothetical protein